MIKRYLIIFAVIVLVFPSFAEEEVISDKAKEAIQKAIAEREADAKAREEFKAKTSKTGGVTLSIPGKLLYRGNVEKTTSDKYNSNIIIIKLKDGKLLRVPFGTMFTRDTKPLFLGNISPGIQVAIVTDLPPTPQNWVGGERSKNIPCTISKTTKIYCGSDADDLTKYYPPPKPAYRPTKPKKR